MFFIIPPVTRIFGILREQSSLSIFHIIRPMSLVGERNIMPIEIDSITFFEPISPKTLKNNSSISIIFIFKKNQFAYSIEFVLFKLTNIFMFR